MTAVTLFSGVDFDGKSQDYWTSYYVLSDPNSLFPDDKLNSFRLEAGYKITLSIHPFGYDKNESFVFVGPTERTSAAGR